MPRSCATDIDLAIWMPRRSTSTNGWPLTEIFAVSAGPWTSSIVMKCVPPASSNQVQRDDGAVIQGGDRLCFARESLISQDALRDRTAALLQRPAARGSDPRPHIPRPCRLFRLGGGSGSGRASSRSSRRRPFYSPTRRRRAGYGDQASLPRWTLPLFHKRLRDLHAERERVRVGGIRRHGHDDAIRGTS